MLGIAHAFETFGRLAPCELCLKERQVYWVATAVAAAGGGLSLASSKARPWVCAALGLIFLGGAGLAAYHAGVEWKFWTGPASCSGGHVDVTAADLTRLLQWRTNRRASLRQACLGVPRHLDGRVERADLSGAGRA